MTRSLLRRMLVSQYFDLPNGFIIILVMSFFIMFDFNMMTHTILINCTNNFDFSENDAWLLYRSFIAVTCFMPVLGGLLSNRLLSYRLSIVTGLSFATIGLFLLCFNSIFNLYLGLSCFAVGLGLTVPSIFIVLSYLLETKASKRTSHFVLFFICVAAGSLISADIAIPIANEWGYQGCFLLAAIGTLLAIMIFIPCLTPFISNKHFIALTKVPATRRSGWVYQISGIVCALLLIPIISRVLFYAEFNTTAIYFSIVIIAGYCAGLYINATPTMRPKFSAYFFLLFIGIGFWTLYMFLPSLLTIFIEEHVNNQVFTHEMNANQLLNLNPIFIILLGILIFFIWQKREYRRGLQAAYQFAIAITLIGFAFLILDFGIFYNQTNGKIALIWVFMSYTLQALAELHIVPIGASIVCKLTPKEQHGIFMGIWIFAIQIGNMLASQLINLTYQHLDTSFFNLPNHFYAGNFTRFGIMAITLGILTSLLAPKIQMAFEL